MALASSLPLQAHLNTPTLAKVFGEQPIVPWLAQLGLRPMSPRQAEVLIQAARLDEEIVVLGMDG